MNHGMLLLFAVPAICIAVVAFAQFGDELFNKKFVIERRIRTAKSRHSRSNRRHSDAKASSAIATSCFGLHAWRGDENVLDVGCGRGLLPRRSSKAHRRSSKAVVTLPASTSGRTSTWVETPPPPPSTTSTSKASPPSAPFQPTGAGDDLPRRHLRRHRLQPLPPQYLRCADSPPGAPSDCPRPQTRRRRPHLRLQTHRRVCRRVSQSRPIVEKKRGSLITTFPPLTVVIARKPM